MSDLRDRPPIAAARALAAAISAFPANTMDPQTSTKLMLKFLKFPKGASLIRWMRNRCQLIDASTT